MNCINFQKKKINNIAFSFVYGLVDLKVFCFYLCTWFIMVMLARIYERFFFYNWRTTISSQGMIKSILEVHARKLHRVEVVFLSLWFRVSHISPILCYIRLFALNEIKIGLQEITVFLTTMQCSPRWIICMIF